MQCCFKKSYCNIIKLFNFWISLKNNILSFIKINKFEFHWNIWFCISLDYMILNTIEIYFEFHWNIWFQISLNDLFLNVIERCYIESNWKIWFWMLLKFLILNLIKNKNDEMYPILTSILSLANKSLTISTFFFSTAINNNVR